MAAGCDPDSAVGLSHLAASHFVRVRDLSAGRAVEPYHDRIREAIVAAMPLERRKTRHLDLAHALEAQDSVDAALVATHFRSAGEFETAARYSVSAGDQAAQTLAFDRAAQWYQLALTTGTWAVHEATSVRRQLADVLAHAGHGERLPGCIWTPRAVLRR